MTMKECIQLTPDYEYLIGKTIVFEGKEYIVEELVPFPTDEQKIKAFAIQNLTYDTNTSLIKIGCYTDKNLDLMLKCSNQTIPKKYVSVTKGNFTIL